MKHITHVVRFQESKPTCTFNFICFRPPQPLGAVKLEMTPSSGSDPGQRRQLLRPIIRVPCLKWGGLPHSARAGMDAHPRVESRHDWINNERCTHHDLTPSHKSTVRQVRKCKLHQCKNRTTRTRGIYRLWNVLTTGSLPASPTTMQRDRG